jgi:hypothetical protein
MKLGTAADAAGEPVVDCIALGVWRNRLRTLTSGPSPWMVSAIPRAAAEIRRRCSLLLVLALARVFEERGRSLPVSASIPLLEAFRNYLRTG